MTWLVASLNLISFSAGNVRSLSSAHYARVQPHRKATVQCGFYEALHCDSSAGIESLELQRMIQWEILERFVREVVSYLPVADHLHRFVDEAAVSDDWLNIRWNVMTCFDFLVHNRNTTPCSLDGCFLFLQARWSLLNVSLACWRGTELYFTLVHGCFFFAI